MTAQEKQKIASLSEKGLGYRKIAAQIGISENTVKSYLKRMTAADDQKEPDQPAAVFSCPQCGKEIWQQPGRKTKRFCSEPIPLPARFYRNVHHTECLTGGGSAGLFVFGWNADFLGVRGLSLWKKLLGYGKILERWQVAVIVG